MAKTDLIAYGRQSLPSAYAALAARRRSAVEAYFLPASSSARIIITTAAPHKIFDFVGAPFNLIAYTVGKAFLRAPQNLQFCGDPSELNRFAMRMSWQIVTPDFRRAAEAAWAYSLPASSSARIIITTASSRDANPPGRRPSVMPSSRARSRASWAKGLAGRDARRAR